MKKKSIIIVFCIVFGLTLVPNLPRFNYSKYNNNNQRILTSDDTYEDNNRISDSSSLEIGNYINLECYDDDYYSVYVRKGLIVTVEIEFNNFEGNLDLELLEYDETILNGSYSSNNNELVSYESSSSQNIYFRVFYIDNPNFYNLSISVIAGDTYETIEVFTPEKNAILNVDSTYEITWSASSQISNVDLILYRKAFPERTIAGGTPNDGSYFWTVPTDAGSDDDYFIVIRDSSNPNTEWSSGILTINNSYIPMRNIDIKTPNSTSVWHNGTSFEIKWNATSNIDYVDIRLYYYLGYITVVEGTLNDGSFWYLVPDSIISEIYTLQIRDNESVYTYTETENFQIINTGDSESQIAISNPFSISRWQTGNQYEIRWITSGDIGNISIYYETPYPGSRKTIVTNIKNDGSYLWDVPTDIDSNIYYMIRIQEASDQNNYGQSQEFIIENFNDPNLFIEDPYPAEYHSGNEYNITWTTTGNIENVTLTISNQYSESCDIASDIPNMNYYEWSVPENLIGGKNYVIGIYDSSDPNIYSETEEIHIINEKDPQDTISLESPGLPFETLYTGNTYEITWTSTGWVENVSLKLYNNLLFETMIVENTPNNGSYRWKIPVSLDNGTEYQIVINNHNNCTPYDSTAYFEIINDHSITVINPTGGTVWEKQKTYEIQWTTTGSISHVKIIYEYWGGNAHTIISSTENDGSYLWTLPGSLTSSNDYQIVIQEVDYPNIEGASPEFEVTGSLAPSISLTNPTSGLIWDVDQIYDISWTYTGIIDNVDILLIFNSSSQIIASSITNDGSYSWNISSILKTFDNYKILIRDSTDFNVNDTSDSFTINATNQEPENPPTPTSPPGIPGYNLFLILPVSIIVLFLIVSKKREKEDY